ncbi:MAG: hypothetical protein R6U58_10250 [Bacteroidales bacterium]
MTTNGWRRFRWDDLIAGRYPYLCYPAGTGHIIDGRVSLIKQHDVPVRAKVMLSALGDEFFASSQVTGEDGRARVSFFTSDKASVYRIIIEGMTETGIPVVKTKELWVQENRPF